MTNVSERNKNRFSFDRSVCLGDIIQTIMIGGGIIWFFAQTDAKIAAFGRELDDLHIKVAELHDDVLTMKARTTIGSR